MPTNLELLASLRDGFENMSYQDREKLSGLDNRGRMLIRRTFGEDSDYYRRFIRLEVVDQSWEAREVVAVQKEPQANLVHPIRFGERQALAHEA